jgi:hypothetical protein
VTDHRSGAGGMGARLAGLLDFNGGRRAPVVRPEARRLKAKGQDTISKSERTVVVPVRLTGPSSWAISGCERTG